MEIREKTIGSMNRSTSGEVSVLSSHVDGVRTHTVHQQFK